MNEQKVLWNRLISGPRSDYMLRTAMWRVARGLSTISGQTINHGSPQIDRVPITQVSTYAGSPEAEKVGIYLVMRGGLHGQALLILSISSALHLADLMMGDPPGTATELGAMERSSLAEIGNLAVSAFLNTMARIKTIRTQNTQALQLLRPSPPAVMVDMLGAILNVIVTPVAAVRDDLLIVDTTFGNTPKTVFGRFWIIPDPAIKELAV
ncbi:MAG: hypothetical protein GY832_45485 [Chloroflexi bacterium]|nr:hypothetical protein [Chloroflexota bacterium]